MTDGDFIISWGADDDDQVTELPRDPQVAPGGDQVIRLEEELAARRPDNVQALEILG